MRTKKRKKPIERGRHTFESAIPFSKARDDFHAEIRSERGGGIAGIEKQASRQSRQSILTRNPR